MGLGDNIKRARKAKGWTLRDLSEKAGVSHTSIARYEQGDRSPSYKNLLRIAGALNVDASELADQKASAPIERPEYVTNQSTLMKWSNMISADQSLSDYACLIILAMPMFADPATWIVSITIDSFVDRVKRLDVGKVESHWQEVLDSQYIERIGTGEWTLLLKFPE
jgi:transcriptional regulator with XRE-family HTH domain